MTLPRLRPRQSTSGTALAAVAALLLSALPGSAAPKPGERIAVTACPYPGTVSTCLLLKAPDGMVYNISGASPRPRLIGRMIRLRGLVTDKTSMCGQGVVLDRIRWTRTRQKCPN